jgi:hypothetical protein
LFEQRADLIETVRGLSRAEAERAAYEQVLITFLNKTYPDTSAHACAECAGPDTPAAQLLPFGVGERHTWLHQRCWAAWRERRRNEAIAVLAAIGIVEAAS